MRGMRRVYVRRVAVWPVVRAGALAGAMVGVGPGIVGGMLLRLAAGAVRHTLESWAAVHLPSPVPVVSAPPVSFTALLHLERALEVSRAWDTPLLPAAAALVAAVLGALCGGLAALLAVAMLHASAAAGRGIAVYVEEDDER